MYVPRAGIVCVPHGTLPWTECAGPRYTPPRGPRGEGTSVGDPRPGLPGLGGQGRMGNHAPGWRDPSSGTKSMGHARGRNASPRMRGHGGGQKAEEEPPWPCPGVERPGAPCAVAIWTRSTPRRVLPAGRKGCLELDRAEVCTWAVLHARSARTSPAAAAKDPWVYALSGGI